jgi:hypothetical protein
MIKSIAINSALNVKKTQAAAKKASINKSTELTDFLTVTAKKADKTKIKE